MPRSIYPPILLVLLVAAGCLGGAKPAPTSPGAAESEPTPGPGEPGQVPEAPPLASKPAIPARNASDGRPPYRRTPVPATTLVEVAEAKAPGGYRLTLWDDVAYLATVTSAEAGVVAFDVRNPERPREISRIQGTTGRIVDILPYGNRTLAAVSAGGPLLFFDVTDPSDPQEVARFDVVSHNVGVHRPGLVVYNARSLGDVTGAVEIFDAQDPDNIRLHKVWLLPPTAEDGTPIENPGCHEFTIYPDVARAYCPAVTQTLVLDVSVPLEPRVLTAISNPLIQSHHTAFTLHNHTVLVINDEFAAGFAYGCFGRAPTPAGDVSTTPSALWFYDLTMSPPQPISWFSAEAAEEKDPQVCTSHTGTEVVDGSGIIAYAWTDAGSLLIDARDPATPKSLFQLQGEGKMWDLRFYRGYVFGANDARGLVVFRPE